MIPQDVGSGSNGVSDRFQKPEATSDNVCYVSFGLKKGLNLQARQIRLRSPAL
jgi:hypothetical protein